MGQSKLKSKPDAARKPDLRNRPFLVISAISRPSKDVNTSAKGWNENRAAMTTFERVSIVDRVSNRIMRDAVCILDLTRREVVTSRFAHMTPEQVFEHYLTQYQDLCEEGMRAWIDKLSSQMARDPKFIAEMQERSRQIALENGITVVTDEALVAQADGSPAPAPAEDAGDL